MTDEEKQQQESQQIQQQAEELSRYVAQEAGSTYGSSILLISRLKQQNASLVVENDGLRKEKAQLLEALKKSQEALDVSAKALKLLEGCDKDGAKHSDTGHDQVGDAHADAHSDAGRPRHAAKRSLNKRKQ